MRSKSEYSVKKSVNDILNSELLKYDFKKIAINFRESAFNKSMGQSTIPRRREGAQPFSGTLQW